MDRDYTDDANDTTLDDDEHHTAETRKPASEEKQALPPPCLQERTGSLGGAGVVIVGEKTRLLSAADPRTGHP